MIPASSGRGGLLVGAVVVVAMLASELVFVAASGEEEGMPASFDWIGFISEVHDHARAPSNAALNRRRELRAEAWTEDKSMPRPYHPRPDERPQLPTVEERVLQSVHLHSKVLSICSTEVERSRVGVGSTFSTPAETQRVLAVEYRARIRCWEDNARAFATSKFSMVKPRVPLIPPPPVREVGVAARESHEVRPDGGTRGKSPQGNTPQLPAERLPSDCRGKSSGEFERVVPTVLADTNRLVTEAEGWIARLTSDDNYRRLLQLAVLRRDAVLLSGLLEVVRQRR